MAEASARRLLIHCVPYYRPSLVEFACIRESLVLLAFWKVHWHNEHLSHLPHVILR